MQRQANKSFLVLLTTPITYYTSYNISFPDSQTHFSITYNNPYKCIGTSHKGRPYGLTDQLWNNSLVFGLGYPEHTHTHSQ